MESLSAQLQPFFQWLLRVTMQASLLICLILLIQVILGGKLGVRWRYCLWLVLLIRMAMPWAPQSRVSMFNLIPQSLPKRQIEYVTDEVADDTLKLDLADKDTSKSESLSATAVPQETPKAIAVAPETHKEPAIRLKPHHFKAVSLLPLIWLVGALILGIYICINNFTLLHVVRCKRPLTDQKILDLLEDCKAEMGIRTILGVVPTDKVRSASLFGFIRPRLLLPQGMVESLSYEELRYIFLHELAHLKRHDIYIGWLMSILQVLHWFNPLVWLAFYRIRADRELACDALVLARTEADKSRDYGNTIVSLLERFSRPQRLPAMAGILETKSQLKRRITMIARFKKNSYQWSPLAIILIILLAGVVLSDAPRERASAKPSPGMTLRQVRMESGGFASLSPDGKYMCDVDWDTGNLVVRELATGNVRPLTDKGGWSWDEASFATASVISRDSKRVIFLWYNHEGQCFDLREIGLDGSGNRVVRRLLEKDKEKEWFEPAAWSPDGKQILGPFSRKGEHNQIVWVSTADGSVRTVKVLDEDWPGKLDVSPDGRYIAYDLPQEKETLRRDIFAFDIEENREVPLVQHPADDKFMGWTPDGKYIFFTSDRMGSWDGWILPVARGEPSGLPELVKASIGDVSPIGFTQGGSFYYAPAYNLVGVYTAALDLQTGTVLSSPKPVRHTGIEGLPDWSPDGKHLAYCTRPRGEKSQIIHIRSVETGQERQLDAKLPHFRWLRWSPDGRFILVGGLEEKDLRNFVYKVDVLTGERTVVLKAETGMIPGAALFPDGKTLVYSHWDRAARTARFMVRDLETGLDKQLVRATYGPHPYQQAWALSPDGKQLAFILESPGAGTLNTISTTGGERKEILSIKKKVGAVAWTPDNQNILFMRGKTLWRIPAEGGEPRKLWIWEKRHLSFEGIRVHPDGRNVAFGVTEPIDEVWVMENFLPEAPVAKPAHKPNFRKIRIHTGMSWDPLLSPDGQKLALSSDEKLWIIPLSGKLGPEFFGAPTELNTGNVKVERCGLAWSRDGKWIAFNDCEYLHNKELEGNQGIHIVSAEGGKPNKVHENYRDARTINYRISLSPHGRILAFTSVDANEQHIYTISVDGGSPKQLVDAQAREPVFSPDGRIITYVEDKNLGIGGGGLWTVPADGGSPTLVANAGNASSPVWSPDGRMIAFLDYEVSKKIYIIPIGENGGTTGEVFTIDTPGEVKLLAGWTPDNKIGAIFTSRQEFALYTLPAKGGKATMISYGGYPIHPRWSPDGKRIFHTNNEDEKSGDWQDLAMAVVPAEGGTVTTIPIQSDDKIRKPAWGGGNNVSTDGKTIVFVAQTIKDTIWHWQIWTLPVDGGKPKQITKTPVPIINGFPCWSPDGKAIAFVRTKVDKNYTKGFSETNIYTVSASGGEPRQLTSESDHVDFCPIAWSPDGELIAYYSLDEGIEDSPMEMKVLEVNNGISRVVGKVRGGVNIEMAWSPDSKRIAYNGPDDVIKVISIDDGSVVDVETDLGDIGIYHLDWSPDGNRFAFAGGAGGDPEFWIMENFLPVENK